MLHALLIVTISVVVALLALEILFPASAARFFMGLERRRSGLEERESNVDGVRLRWLEGGQGETLVLLHGFGADKDNYTRVARFLTPYFRVVIPDLPGFGDSQRLEDAAYPFADQTRRLHGLLHGLGITRCHIAGSSMGGAIAALYGAYYPDEVQSRWLLAPAGVDGSQDSEMAAHFRATGESLLLPTSVADFRRVMDLAVEIKPALTPSIRKTLGTRAMNDLALHTRIFEEIAFAEPINETMRTSDVPTLIVWGDRDRVLHVSGASILHETLPNSRLIIMEGLGHLPMVEAPQESAEDFVEFVRQLRRDQSDSPPITA